MSLLSEDVASQPQPQQTASTPPNLPHLCDQLVPEGFSKDCAAPPSGKDFEDLRLAISHLRAERQAHVQSFQTAIPNTAPHKDQGEPIQELGRNAASTSLDLSPSTLQMELGGDKAMVVRADGRRSRGTSRRGAESRCQANGIPVRALGDNQASSNGSLAVATPSAATTARLSDQAKPGRHGGKEANRPGEPAFPAEADYEACKTPEQDAAR